jgi:uncharacterized membrane protein
MDLTGRRLDYENKYLKMESQPTMQKRTRHEIIGYLLGISAVVMFAGSLPFTRLALTGYSPWFITFGRAVIATIIAVVFIVTLSVRLKSRFGESNGANFENRSAAYYST